MAQLDALFPGKYLKESSLQGRTHVVVIERVTIEDVGQEKERRPVLTFRGKDLGLVLNKTNAEEIALSYGRDTDGWMGKQIELYPAMTSYQGKRVPCIRVRVPAGAEPAPPPVSHEDDSDIPF